MTARLPADVRASLERVRRHLGERSLVGALVWLVRDAAARLDRGETLKRAES